MNTTMRPLDQPESTTEREVRMVWTGPVSSFMRDTAGSIDLEGAFRSGKTTAALWKVLTSCLEHPGIQWLVCRYSDSDTQSKLRPNWRAVCEQAGVVVKYRPDEQSDELPNGSKAYIFGLKAQDQQSRYAKLRGIGAGGLAGVYCDQAEELPHDVFLEFSGRLSQPGHPHQLILTPNPPEEGHWIATEFPEDNHVKHRKYYRVSVYDNQANLPAETIHGLVLAYPPGHAKHRPAVLGMRGLNVIGSPVYGAISPHDPETAAFQRVRHERPLALDPDLPLVQCIDYGKRHPCVVWLQHTPWAELRVLGGVLGQDLYLDEFLPILQQQRATWFPEALQIATCCDPAGSHDSSQGMRQNGVSLLREAGISPIYRQDSNAPDVRLAMIDRIAAYMRRRSARGEAFGVDNARWIRVSATAQIPHRFIADGLEAGYVWDEHLISVGHKQVRRPKKDGWYEHGMNCFSADTDVLTDSGWRPFADLSEVDALATVNLETDQIEYHRPLRRIRQEHDGPMVAFGGKLNALVTPEHRMVIYQHTNDSERPRPRIVSASDCRVSQRIKLSARWAGSSPEAMLVPATSRALQKEIDPGDWAEFMGWYVAEGCYSKRVKCPGWGYRVVVSQTKPESRAYLKALCARLPWTAHETTAGFQFSSEQLWRVVQPLGDRYTKSVPAWIRWASPELIARFLAGAVAGDGYVSPSGHRQYFTVSGMLADQMQELFLKVGRSASVRLKPAAPYHIRGRSGTNTRPQFHLNEWRTAGATLRDSQARPTFKEVSYRGLVYCATVPTGTLIVRRDGRPFVAGNCLEYGEHNFGGLQPTLDQTTRRAAQIRARDLTHRQHDRDPYDQIALRRSAVAGRGGY